ncbi:hypothetical protein [Novosphingobium sp. JCM 18896]|uniref:hypothetical protein n=1 Tax=Novosphingobium sp. JCM 18896 TaxID=2989731 RepID=UPI002223B896|nr:hypothetical protein [Novosphingobium sp. JCM 18896]MCW1432440.1 hypothetical protein [Novosphingobium sp. JCM 18896]
MKLARAIQDQVWRLLEGVNGRLGDKRRKRKTQTEQAGSQHAHKLRESASSVTKVHKSVGAHTYIFTDARSAFG